MSTAQNTIDRGSAERRELPPQPPESERSPRETGEWMRRQSELAMDDAIRAIDQAWEMAADDPLGAQQLEQLRQEAAAAKAELDSSIAAAEADFDIDVEVGESVVETEDVGETVAAVEAMLDKTDGYFGDLDALAETAAKGGEARQAILEHMRYRLGNRAADILDSPELRRELAGMAERLKGRLGGENGPKICEALTLSQLMGLRETMGADPEKFLAAIDVKKRMEAAGSGAAMEYSPGSLLDVTESWVDEKTGELVSSVTARMLQSVEPDSALLIERVFKREVVNGPDGRPRVAKNVEHSLFEMPDHLKANGLAADVTRDSLAEYDKMGIDTIKLHANIDMGGYAWAVYGYGWDKKEMAKRVLQSKDSRERDVEVGGVKKKAKDLSPQELETMVDQEADFLNAEAVAEVMSKGRQELADAFAEVGHADAEALLRQFDQLAKNDLTITPQSLAEFGRQGSKLFLDTRTPETWHTAESLAAAVRDGRLSAEDAKDIGKKPFHAGKIVLRNANWHGKIDLKTDGPQGGKNRELLERYLNKDKK